MTRNREPETDIEQRQCITSGYLIISTKEMFTLFNVEAASQFSGSAAAIGRRGRVARRCVGWASTAIMCLIWELNMADWLGSRAEPVYLCCTSSTLTPGPNKHLVIDTNTLMFLHTGFKLPPNKHTSCCGPSWFNSFCDFCHMRVLKCCCRRHERGIAGRLAVNVTAPYTWTHADTHNEAHAQL